MLLCQVSRCTMLISSPTNFFAKPGIRSDGQVCSTTTSMPLPAPSTVTARRTACTASHTFSPEGGVGEHLSHGLRGGVIGHRVRELHGAHHVLRVGGPGRRDAGPTLAGVSDQGVAGEWGGNEIQFGEQGAQLTYGSYLRLRAAARRPAPRVRPAGARRAAVHHHPPGLRAVVPAAAARGDRGPRRDARGRRRAAAVVGPAPAPADARHRAGAGPAGRRAGDDDAAGLPGVPAAAGARPAASSRCSSASWSSSPAPRTRRTSTGSGG